MKKTLILAGLIASMSAMAQGTLNFANFATGLNVPFTVDATVDAATPKLGATYVAQLWAGTAKDSLSPVGQLVAFKESSGKGSGLFLGGTFNFDGKNGMPTYPGSSQIWAQVAVFPGADGSYDAAANAGHNVGKSIAFQVTLGDPTASPPIVPGNLTGLSGNPVTVKPIPEPSVIALGLLGAGALLIRRRK